MPDEGKTYAHISDTDTVFMKHPANDGVGSCLGKAFKEVYAPQGYIQVDQATYDAHIAKLNDERAEFVPTGVLAPPSDGDAQNIINAERGAGEPVAAAARPKHRGEG